MSHPERARALVQRGRLDSPFFRSKFRVPAAPDHFVHRTRLVALLDDLAAYPVTAVVAPAGAGKTALAADWVRRGDRPSAWLALDDSDRDPAQLSAAVATAVDSLVPGVADRTTGRPADALRLLADDLDGVDVGSAVLVLDDVHRVDDDEPTRAALEGFIEHKPAWLHLLLLSRRRPPLPVDRMRATGTLADIGFDALRFSDDEALAMLAGLCPQAAPDDLVAVAGRADGWAAALQLAALAVRSGRAALAGSERLVDSYVWREVMRTERSEMVGMLLSTAVADRVNYGLAEALAGRPDAGDLLVEAEERGLFVTRLDPGGWFEVHGLVREMLLAELGRRRPELLREQHLRAARWFEGIGDGATALEHWLDAGEPAEALRLLASISVGLVDDGRGAAIERVLARIPSEVSAADTVSLVRLAWCRLLVDRTGFRDALAAAEAALARSVEDGEDGEDGEGGQLDVLRAVAAHLDGDWEACVARADAGVRGLGGGAMADPIGRFGWSLLAHGIALRERWDDADPAVGEARVAASTDAGRRLAHEGARAVGLALAGHPLDALRVSAGIRHVVDTADLATVRRELELAEAVAARELDDRARAESALEALLARPSYPGTYVPVFAHLELAEMRLDAGDLRAAGELLERAAEIAERDLAGVDGRTRVARAGVLVALGHDDLTGAGRWADRIRDSFWGPLSEARVHLAAAHGSEALDAARSAEPRCIRHRVVRELVLARSVVGDDRDAAVKAVEVAVDLAAEHGLLRSVAAEGGEVLELVELAAWRASDAWLARLRRALAPGVAAPGPMSLPIEELTERERDVLRLLPSRLTLREIATELFVSQNTLKFHLRIIYRKLGVNSRGAAVQTARTLRLLAR